LLKQECTLDILLKGYYGYGNLGDDLLMQISYRILNEKFPKSKIDIFSNNSINNKDTLVNKNYNLYINKLIPDPIKIVDWTYKNKYDLIFDGGGGIYFDNNNAGLKWKIINSIYSFIGSKNVYNAIRKLKPLNITYKNRISFGVGIEKYHPNSSTYLSDINTMANSSHIFVRDDFSNSFLSTNRINQNYTLTTDTVFLTQYWKNLNIPTNSSEKLKKIGIVYNGTKPIADKINQLALKLTESGYIISFFSFNPLNDNLPQSGLNNNNVNAWNPSKESITSYLSKMSEMDILVTARAHGAIIGACLEIPSICINMSVKLKEVSKMMKKSSILVDIDEIGHAAFEHIEVNKNKRKALVKLLKDDLNKQQLIAQNGLSKLKQEFLKIDTK